MYGTTNLFAHHRCQLRESANIIGGQDKKFKRISFDSSSHFLPLSPQITCIRAVCFVAREDYPTKKFADWVQLWPGQAVICVANYFWTMTVTEKLETLGNEGMKIHYEYMVESLRDIVALVRTEIPKIVRCTLEALIVIYVRGEGVGNRMLRSE
jgi:hypothetical protein